MDINNAKVAATASDYHHHHRPAAVQQVSRKGRTKLKAINNFLICNICKGYIIDATAISDCLHSFCRSCIVKHLMQKNHCPKCLNEPISIANLRPDDIINSLVYKVVPALYQSECQRKEVYYKKNGQTTTVDGDDKIDQKQHYFSPDEPISLSLTYHTESLVGSGITTPPINYLQCPAAVTVHHLKRFVSAKYGINVERDVNIEIICEDEVLPEDFTLMDVAYCFNWTRVSPMQLMFRILLYQNNNNDKSTKSKDVPVALESDSNHNRVGIKAVGQVQPAAGKNNGSFQVSKENHNNYRSRETSVVEQQVAKPDQPKEQDVFKVPKEKPYKEPKSPKEVKQKSEKKSEPEADFKRLRSSNPSNSMNSPEKKKTPKTSQKKDETLQVKYEEEKKCYTNPKKEKKEVPKLKIDLPNMTAKIVEDEPKPKIILKLPSPLEKPQLAPEQSLPLEEYAKRIGLQPVKRKVEEPHRKRKKAKHSKEPSKKRKLHAEVSSLNLNDEVKLKVKITHKEKRSSTSEEKLTAKDVDVPQPSEKVEEVKSTSLLRAVRKPMVFIPNAPKISTESNGTDEITEIVNRMKQPMSPPAPPKPMPPPKSSPKSSPKPPTPPVQTTPKILPKPASPKLSVPQVSKPSQQQQPQQQQPQQQQPQQQQVPVMMPQFSQASRLDIRMQRMNSAPRMFNQRPPVPRMPMLSPRPMKRPIYESTSSVGSKTPRLDHMEISAQNRLMKKPIYAPAFGMMMHRNEPPKIQPKPAEVKKLPRLIAPSSISVTKVGDMSNTPAPAQHRPAVEILKIPSSAQTIDRPPNQPIFTTQSATASPVKHKANRPPPAPIPLEKIRKSGFKPDQALDLSAPGKAIRPDLANMDLVRSDAVQSVRNAIDSLRNNSNNTDQSSNGDSKPKSSVRKMDTPVIDLTDSSDKPTSTTTTSTPTQEKKMPALLRPPVPKLKPVRQQNLSVRNVPNPSALAFRNQPTAKATPMKTPPMSKLSEKIQQLHQMQNQRKITPED